MAHHRENAVEVILAGVEQGKSLHDICDADESLPAPKTFYAWLKQDAELRNKYAHAKEIMAEKMAEELLEIADDGRNDWMTIKRGGEEVEVENHEVVNRSKLRLDTRKWLMSKLLPKKYGEKTLLEHTGADGGPLTISWLAEPPKTS